MGTSFFLASRVCWIQLLGATLGRCSDVDLRCPQKRPRQIHSNWVFPKIGVPQNGWFIMENPINMDDLGVPLFLETPNLTSFQTKQRFLRGKRDWILPSNTFLNPLNFSNSRGKFFFAKKQHGEKASADCPPKKKHTKNTGFSVPTVNQ